MKRIRVLYFAAVRDLCGIAEELIELPDEVDAVSALARYLEQTRPKLAGRLSSVRFAVNEAFAAPTERIADGDVIAVIPPVAGG